jgi:hypothetical protein
MRDSHIHVLPKAPKLIRQKRHHCFDESANLHIQGSTRGLVQQPPTRETIADEGRSQGRGGDLILPESLLPEERAAALLLLKPCAQQAQALLDELSARMQARAVHTSPLAYLRGLVRRALAGEFVPELGQRVAAARRRHDGGTDPAPAARGRGAASCRRVRDPGTPGQARIPPRRDATDRGRDAGRAPAGEALMSHLPVRIPGSDKSWSPALPTRRCNHHAVRGSHNHLNRNGVRNGTP